METKELTKIRKHALDKELEFIVSINNNFARMGKPPWIPGMDDIGKFAAMYEKYLIHGYHNE